jgi:hypothetical protein
VTDNLYPVFPTLGVLTEKGNPASARLIIAASAANDQTKLQILNDVGKTEKHDTVSITVDPITDRISFESDGKTYGIREPRESDSKWLSKYKVTLPIEAIRAFAIRGEHMNPDETLDAFASEDSPYVVGVVYTNGVGRWSRIDGDWVLLAPDDDAFDDMEVFEIDAERGEDFLDLYDSNYVSVSDAAQYESAEPDDSDLESSDNISD